MSQGLSRPQDGSPIETSAAPERSVIVVGDDETTSDVASALVDRGVDVTQYDDTVLAIKRYDGGAVDCLVMAGRLSAQERARNCIAGGETVVVRLESRDGATGGADIVVSPSGDPRTIAAKILDALEDHAVDSELARHDRLVRTVHDVTQQAVTASTVAEISRETCDRLVDDGAYDVAWISRQRNGECAVEATAGIDPSMLSGRVPRESSGVSVSEHGSARTAAVPLAVGGEEWGTLGLSRRGRIDRAERELLADLGTVLGEQLGNAGSVEPPTPGQYGFGSREAATTAMKAVRNVELPDAFAKVVDDYEAAFGTRDRFLWQWLHTVFPLFELSCVEDDHLESLRTAKLATSMLVVVLDDLGEDPERYETFQEAAAVPFEHRAVDPDRERVEHETVAFIEDVWEVITETLSEAPRWGEYAETFRFDLRQVVTAIEYAHHVNEYPRVGNVVEAEAYGAHNMMMFPAADIDLAYAPAFDRSELADLRSVVYEAQQMGRIGNWLSTWERELGEGDVHAGTILQALAEGAIDREDLDRVGEDPERREQVVAAIRESDAEGALLERWEEHYRRIHRQQGSVESVDIAAFLSGMVEVFRYHRASRGLK